MEGVQGKVVAITGASSGIGEATALYLAARGAKVVLGARRVERLASVVERIVDAGGAAIAVETDVRSREALHHLVASARSRFGRLDVLHQNAGSMAVSPFDALDVDGWQQMVDVNLVGVLNGIAAALPVFREQGSGHFVHTASTAAHRIVPAQGVYAATKTAVHVLSEALRQEAGPALRVTVVSPGFTATEGVSKTDDPEHRAALEARMATIAMPADAVAAAVAYAIAQPEGIDVGEVVIRPTAQD
ncbi:oxidoreductase [Curtobacterium sp. MCBD17_013]|uniref:SDR family oxidoreductase n=1 Tax=Curtobacterium sp. MCBD17_013 TaxID=2175668 RepID=UPI000DA8E2D7|nr:SDR family oxidoreductase [Curtobacterium sp. MCBD17_013]PZF61526.1 oxidoreductase [Curtobacterium sp. MCBD17_013]